MDNTETNQTPKKSHAGIIVILAIVIIVGALLYLFFSGSNGNGNVSGKAILQSGQKASDFSLPSTNGSTITLSDYKGKKNVLLYFQEGIMCAPCWTQMQDMQTRIDEFNKLDVEILTITVDPLTSLKQFVSENGITLPVLADENLQVSKQYGILDDSMHPGQTPGHALILVDKEGNIKWTDISGTRMYVPIDEILQNLKKYLG